MTLVPLWNPEMIGTAIVGHYRSGTHFLYDVIRASVRAVNSNQEVDDIAVLKTATKTQVYQLAILNHHDTKMRILCDRLDLLRDWHVVKLTRRDKVSHFISHWFWSLNTHEQRMSNTGQYLHHGTPHQAYAHALAKTYLDPQLVLIWLQEQMVNDYLRYDYTLDYSDLSNYSVPRVQWNSNRYGDITLADIFTNHQEIHDILANYRAIPYIAESAPC